MRTAIGNVFGISIHALLAESDCTKRATNDQMKTFLSTLSLRRATSGAAAPAPGAEISIHALLAESDIGFARLIGVNTHFYPRSPCGERQPAEHHASSQQEFLSTLSLRRATIYQERQGEFFAHFYPRSPCGERQPATSRNNKHNMISIHALLAESDYLGAWKSCNVCDFYPRSPCGERPEAINPS